MKHAEIYEALKTEHAASLAKHGKWRDLPALDQADAIASEFEEWRAAYYSGDIHGEHGELRELLQLANTCFRRMMALTGEDQ